MRGIQISKQAIFSFLIVTISTLLLSGCLVENSDPLPVIDRSTDTLRTIQSGERLVYRLSGQRSINNAPSTINGTMTVTWTADFIEDPHDPPNQINVLREETVIAFDQGGGTTTIRYVTQDPDGSLNVHAYYNKTDIAYMGDFAPSPYLYQPIQIVSSPLTMANSTFSYRVLDECDVASCVTSLRAINETVEYNSEAVITIDAGRSYNSLYYNYTGFFLEANTAPLPVALDYRRTFCGTNAVEFFGEYYYFPEVGLVRFQSACSGIDSVSGDSMGHNISGSLLSASFQLP